MIEFNQKDNNMTAIEKTVKFSDLKLRYNYRVYGLKQEDNPAVLLEYNPSYFETLDVKPLMDFFKTNDLNFCAQKISDDKNRIYIGLRKDLRQEIDLATAIINTLVYYIEGKMKLSNEDKIAKIPNFVIKSEITQP